MTLLKIDLCSGTAAPTRKLEGYTTLDARPFDGVDHVLMLGQDPLPFEDDSVDYIRASDALEHIREGFVDLMDECFRVIKPRGTFEIHVPRFPTPSAIMHPDHWQFFLSAEDAEPFAQAVAPLLLGQVQRLFCVHSWSFFLPPADGIDPHGYLKGFWHMASQKADGSHLHVRLSPNKPGGEYPYTHVITRDSQTQDHTPRP